MLNFWENYKTKIISFLGILTAAALAFKWINVEQAAAIAVLLGSGAASTVHHAVVREAAIVAAKVAQVEAKVEQVPVATAQAVTPVVVKAASLVAQETVAASVPPLVRLTGIQQNPLP